MTEGYLVEIRCFSATGEQPEISSPNKVSQITVLQKLHSTSHKIARMD